MRNWFRKITGDADMCIDLLVQIVWRAGFYLRHVSKTIDSMRHSKIASALFLFLSIYSVWQFGLKLQIASWFAVVRSRNSSLYSLGTVLHPRPPRHSRLSDVRNKERLKHKGCSVRDIQANPAVNAMEQESLWTRTSLEEQSTCSRHNQSRPEKFRTTMGRRRRIGDCYIFQRRDCLLLQRQERGVTTR